MKRKPIVIISDEALLDMADQGMTIDAITEKLRTQHGDAAPSRGTVGRRVKAERERRAEAQS